MSLNLSATTDNKPVVVLAGWLGCQPRNLRRFSQMYKRMGSDTIQRIASPRSVVAAMTKGPSGHSSQLEMEQLAINILQELQTIQPPYFTLHLFSNNGCFLWEWIRYLLFGQDSPLSCADSNVDVHNLRLKLVGVVFDSAPAYYDGNTDTLESALHYVSSSTERNNLLEITKSLDVNVVKQRFDNFWSSLCNDSTDIPQLYLYSQCDKLASAEHLEKLIAHRKEFMGERKIWKHMFLDSEHCCHILKYPEEYDELIKQFLSFCTSQIGGACVDAENDFSRRSRL
mmetsp:Transcript_16221/g.35055  ORF Transcript_16221/g.35055 Transcript_16221/m.35055 type:complete len:284 (-) Transcript_16221:809-1660(-)